MPNIQLLQNIYGETEEQRKKRLTQSSTPATSKPNIKLLENIYPVETKNPSQIAQQQQVTKQEEVKKEKNNNIFASVFEAGKKFISNLLPKTPEPTGTPKELQPQAGPAPQANIQISQPQTQSLQPVTAFKVASNLLDEAFKGYGQIVTKGIETLETSNSPIVKSLVNRAKQVYDKPITFLIPPVELIEKVSKGGPAAKTIELDNKVLRSIIRTGIGLNFGSSEKVQSFLNTELEKQVTTTDKTANTIGQVIGTIGTYAAGGEILGALKFGKLALPVLFGTLGQTSLPVDTPEGARLRNAVIDSAAGTLFAFIKPAKNLLSLESVTSLTKSLGVLSGQIYADARSLGATHEQALEQVKSSALIMIGLHGALITAKAGKVLTQSKIKEGAIEFTPEQARDQVNNTNLEGTSVGDVILKKALEAEAKGQNLAIYGTATQKAPVAKALNLKTPEGISIGIDLVEPTRMALLKEEGKPQGQAASIADSLAPYQAEVGKYTNAEDFSRSVFGTGPGSKVGVIDASKITPRDPVDQGTVDTYKQQINSGQPIEAINVSIEKGEIVTVNGTQRTIAGQQTKSQVPVIVTKDDGSIPGLNLQTIGDFYRKAQSVLPTPTVEQKPPVPVTPTTPETGQVGPTVTPPVQKQLKVVTPEIPQELQPLAQSVKNYKTSTEFVAASIFDYSLSGRETTALEQYKGKTTADKLTIFYNQIKTTPLPSPTAVKPESQPQKAEIKQNTSERGVPSPVQEVRFNKVGKKMEPKKVISTKDSRAIQTVFIDKLEEFRTQAKSQEEIVKLTQDLVDKTTVKAQGDKTILSAMRTALNKELQAYIPDTGMGFKNNYGVFQETRQNPDISDHIDMLERNRDNLDDLLLTPTTPSGFASDPIYASLPLETKKTYDNISIIEFPEIVKLARELMGKFPEVTTRFGPYTAGRFYYTEGGKIKLNASIFSKPEVAAKVLAHEIGHLIDYLPDYTMARGNLLGRLASLNRYLKTMLNEFPDGDGVFITPKDRVRLQKEAKELAKQNFETVSREVVIGTEPTNTQDILDIWNTTTGGIKNPELLAYIQTLTSAQKVELVKTAIRGKVPKWVEFKKTIKETITEKVLKNSPADIKKIYKQLLQDEIIKRRLVDLATVKKELQLLSQKWRPYNPNLAPPSYVKYRNSAAELYADSISVLFNDPVLLNKDAPTFYKTFFNYLDSKPQVKENFFAIQNIINGGPGDVISSREADIRDMFKKGEDLFQAKIAERKTGSKDYVFRLKYELVDQNTKVIDQVTRDKKAGKPVSDDDNPIYWLEGHNYVGGIIKGWVETYINPVYKNLARNDISWEDFGEALFLERVINERGDLANPLGFDPKTAQTQLDHLKKNIGEGKYRVIEQQLKTYREGIKAVMESEDAKAFYSPEVIEMAKKNPAYATYQVLDYFDLNLPASIKHQVGTLKEIANPATATVVKTMSIMRALERNTVKVKIIKWQKDLHAEEIQDAKTAWNGKTHVPVEPRDDKLALFTVMERGKFKGYYIDSFIAKTMERNTTGHNSAVLGAINFFNSKGFRPLFIQFNLGFQSFNFARDYQRAIVNFPSRSLVKSFLLVSRGYARSIKPSIARAFDIPNATISEMENAKILSITYNDLIRGAEEEDQQIDALIRRAGLSPLVGKKQNFFIKPFAAVLDFISRTGDLIETLPKVAAYKELNGKMPSQELASFIRTSIGSPDFMRKGSAYAVYNNVFLFSNAIKEGVRADYNVAFANPRTRAGNWWKRSQLTFLPVMLMFGATLGVFGEELKKMFKNVSEYDKSNYVIVPFGMKDGQTIYMRIPKDETGRLLGAILWKSLNIFNNQKPVPTDIFDIAAPLGGQVPSVTPILTAMIALGQYMSGNNPYDYFRNRNVIPDTEFKAGGIHALKPFAIWEAQTLGASVFMQAYVSEKGTGTKTWYQKLLEAPVASNILGRWLKVSDYGQTEENRQIQQSIEQEAAVKTLGTKDRVSQAISQFQATDQSPEARKKVINDFVKSEVASAPLEDKVSTFNSATKKITLALDLGRYDVNADSIIKASSNQAKAEILDKVKKTMTSDEFKKYTGTLLKEGIITADVIIKLNK